MPSNWSPITANLNLRIQKNYEIMTKIICQTPIKVEVWLENKKKKPIVALENMDLILGQGSKYNC